MTRILSRSDVERLLNMREVVEWMGEAFVALSSGAAIVPVRGFLHLPDSNDGLLTMPAWQSGIGRYAVKLVSLHERNPAHSLPFARACVLVMDSDRGDLLALIEGELLTAIRTGAGSGLATQLLARDDATTVAVLGAGRQAAAQLDAVCAVRDIADCLVISRSEKRGKRFATRMTEQLGVAVTWMDRADPESSDRLRAMDVICTATNSSVPVLSADEVSAGTHVNGVGSHRPDMAELSPELIALSRVFVDHREACLVEAGDLMQPIASGRIGADHIVGELGEVVSGRVPGRRSREEITVFKSVGNGIQDLAVACRLLDKAEALDVGVVVDMD